MATATTSHGPRIERDPWYTSSPYEPVDPPVTRLEDVDLLDQSLYYRGDPHAIWKLMRDQAPIFWHERGGEGTEGNGFWAVTRYEYIMDVHRNVDAFSSVKGPFVDLPASRIPTGVSSEDAPEHRVHRALVGKFFAPRAMRNWEGTIQDIVTSLIDDVIEKGECDFARDIASRLPLLATSALIGVSPDETHDLLAMLETIDSNESDVLAAYNDRVLKFFSACIDERRRTPGENSILDIVANAEIEGRLMTTEEGSHLLYHLFLGGIDSTSHASGVGLLSLFHHPEQMKMWTDDMSCTPSAVEELLRWTAIAHQGMRWVTRDTEVGGQRFAKGDFVTTWYPAASRDEHVFADPYRFDLRRKSSKPIPVFGGGPHHCIGHYFARLELNLLFQSVLARMRDLRQNGPAVRSQGFALIIAPMVSLPIAFTLGERIGTAR